MPLIPYDEQTKGLSLRVSYKNAQFSYIDHENLITGENICYLYTEQLLLQKEISRKGNMVNKGNLSKNKK